MRRKRAPASGRAEGTLVEPLPKQFERFLEQNVKDAKRREGLGVLARNYFDRATRDDDSS
jgi:hypothetical protein